MEFFDSSVRSLGDVGAVFEHDDDTGYYYLYRLGQGEDSAILASIHVSSGAPSYRASDIAIRWSSDERFVFLLIGGVACAAFDAETHERMGGAYVPGRPSPLPSDLLRLVPAAL